jgi:hypothetical protein
MHPRNSPRAKPDRSDGPTRSAPRMRDEPIADRRPGRLPTDDAEGRPERRSPSACGPRCEDGDLLEPRCVTETVQGGRVGCPPVGGVVIEFLSWEEFTIGPIVQAHGLHRLRLDDRKAVARRDTGHAPECSSGSVRW